MTLARSQILKLAALLRKSNLIPNKVKLKGATIMLNNMLFHKATCPRIKCLSVQAQSASTTSYRQSANFG